MTFQSLSFTVGGNPIPKQSFNYGKGHGYPKPAAVAWERIVRLAAIDAMGAVKPFKGKINVEISFYLQDRRTKDIDNLSKAVLDGIKEVVFYDDKQVVNLNLHKLYPGDYDANIWQPGIYVYVLAPNG